MTRTLKDGQLRFVQDCTFEPALKALVVRMTITNLTPDEAFALEVRRQDDLDVDSASDAYQRL